MKKKGFTQILAAKANFFKHFSALENQFLIYQKNPFH
jgi:hypothetical protein